MKPGETTLIEPTSGNTGIALAFVAAARGIARAHDARDDVGRTPQECCRRSARRSCSRKARMKGAIARAGAARRDAGLAHPGQFDNPANPKVHRETTRGRDLGTTPTAAWTRWSRASGRAARHGRGRGLKPRKPSFPRSPSSRTTRRSWGAPGPHPRSRASGGLRAVHPGTDLIGEIVKVSERRSLATSRRLVREEGIMVGISAARSRTRRSRRGPAGVRGQTDRRGAREPTASATLSTPLFDLPEDTPEAAHA